MKTKQIIILFLLSLVFSHIANLGGFFLNWHWQLSIAGLMYFFVPYFYLRIEKSKKWRFVKMLIILSGLYLQVIAAWIIEGKPDIPQVTPILLTPLLAAALAIWILEIINMCAFTACTCPPGTTASIIPSNYWSAMIMISSSSFAPIPQQKQCLVSRGFQII